MATESNLDKTIAAWLEDEAPAQLPDRVLRATFERTRTARQHVGWRALPGRRIAGFVPALAGATAILLVVVLGLGLYFGGRSVAVNPSPTPSATPASPEPFSEIAPGEMVEIPDWPLDERTSPPSVWTGAELIAWGDGIYGSARDGAAYNPVTNTWRVIAEAPLSARSESAVAWTGTEMIVWGGRLEDSFFYTGAAYNPVTDTWRLLPRPPAPFAGKDPRMLWTGEEAVVFGVSGDSETTGEYIAAAAYNPAADTWRTLANAPGSVRLGGGAWWTGGSIVLADVGYDPEFDNMARYDMAADQWTILDVHASAAVVGVPGADGTVSTFINLSSETGAPTQLLDSSGSLVHELPAFPGDPGVFGEVVGASGLWAADEAVFEIWNGGPDYQPEQIWALNPTTQSWRRLDTDTAFPRIDGSVLVVGDVLLTWNRPDDEYRGTPRACCVAPPSKGGSIYRVASP